MKAIKANVVDTEQAKVKGVVARNVICDGLINGINDLDLEEEMDTDDEEMRYTHMCVSTDGDKDSRHQTPITVHAHFERLAAARRHYAISDSGAD